MDDNYFYKDQEMYHPAYVTAVCLLRDQMCLTFSFQTPCKGVLGCI